MPDVTITITQAQINRIRAALSIQTGPQLTEYIKQHLRERVATYELEATAFARALTEQTAVEAERAQKKAETW